MATLDICAVSCKGIDMGIKNYQPWKNCKAAAAFLVPWVDRKTVNMTDLVTYLQFFGGTNVPEYRAMNWFFCAKECANREMNQWLIHKPISMCKDEMCEVWEWDGNTDIVGVGMMFVYLMGAILASLYVASFLSSMYVENDYTTFKTRTPCKEQGFWENIRSMFYNSLGAFHTGLGLLAASVLLATLIICGRKESVYDINMSRLACAILTASYFLTHPVYVDIERKSNSGHFMGFVIWLLFTVVMCMSSPAEAAARLHGRVPFEANCWDLRASLKVSRVIFAFYLIPVVTAMLVGLAYLVGKCTKRPADKVPVLGWLFFRAPWRVSSSIFFFIFMWTALGSLFTLRADIASVNGGGVQESEGSWGFGQILTLATWVPVIEEAIFILYINDFTVTKELWESQEFTNGLIELNITKFKTAFTITAQVRHKDDKFEVLSSATGTRFDLVECGESEVMGRFKTRHIKGFAEENIQHELTELIEHQIQPWMESCCARLTDHEHCGPKHNASGLPTRLVDVGKGNYLMVKLVNVNSPNHIQDFAYLILSYCWGSSNESSKTTENNLKARLCGFSVSELPKTIRDAILLTRMMGYRYLWVDAMCIIQGPSGDFHSESTRMGDYYSNAECCISASDATDSQQVFLTGRPLARFPMEDIAIKIARLGEPGYSIFKSDHNKLGGRRRLLTSPLTKRGWCLQETALAKRILHWTFRGVFLECQSSLFLEGKKDPWEFKGPQMEMSHELYLSPREVMVMPDEDILFSKGWCQLVTDFSKTKLTYETDRLYAIHGLASVLIRRFNAEYFNGLFRGSIAQGLLWYHRTSSHGVCKRPETAQLPSWCWASSCPVEFMSIHRTPIYIRDDHPDRPLRFPTHPGAISTVEGTTSKLYIRAPIIQLEIGRNRVGYIKTSDSGDTVRFECRYYLDSNRRVMRHMPRAGNYHGEWGEGSSVLWMPVGQSAILGNVGLLVHEVPDEGEGVYCRYGLLQFKSEGDSFLDDQRLNDVREITLI
ncbi:ankyrin repeat domain-containing protein [Fusarium coicis]|nr:ankyrin repeat domain-containing protein [Fusarium coicis]